MARKDYPDEFKGDAVALCRDTDGATITQIAAELGVSETTLSAWCKAAGVAIRHRKPGPASVPTAGVETPEQELVRLRAEVGQLRAGSGAREKRSMGRTPRRTVTTLAAFRFAAQTTRL
jgi:transposase